MFNKGTLEIHYIPCLNGFRAIQFEYPHFLDSTYVKTYVFDNGYSINDVTQSLTIVQ